MNEVRVLETLRQASSSEVGAIFQEVTREIIRDSLVDLMLFEVSELCGSFYHPGADRRFKRGGSAKGSIRVDGVKIPVRRPRVHEGGCERSLVSYAAGKSAESIKKAIYEALAAGVSSREVGRLYPRSGCVSSASASRIWVSKGLELFEKLRGREFAGEDFFCLMLDGVSLGSDMTAIVALGITIDGRKMMLDFEIGATENLLVCETLLDRLLRRGFKDPSERRLVVVLDGSDALRSGVLSRFDDPLIQRCQVHKERNIRACLSKRHHGELARLFKNLRNAEGAEAAREALGELRAFLSRLSSKALNSLDEAGEDLIAVQCLGSPSTLHSTLLNTNAIENSINNIRRKIGRVKRWRGDTNQAERWLAFGMFEAELGFQRIKGYRNIGKFLKKLERPPHSPQLHSDLAAPRRPSGRSPLRGGECGGERGLATTSNGFSAFDIA